MTDSTFETLFAGQLREYAEAGVRPIDRHAVAEETIATGRPRFGRRWTLGRARRPLVLVLLTLLTLGLAASAAIIGSRLLAPPSLLEAPRIYLGEMVSAPDLSVPRWLPELVLLDDGRVLIIGGNDGAATTSEIYDPRTGRSLSTGRMVSADALDVSSAVRLRDGRVLVVGDARPFDAPFFAVAQIFDPTTMLFESVGPMVTPRAGAQLALLPDGRVLMTGGTTPVDINTTLASAEVFDPVSSTFSGTMPMRTSRHGHALATLLDGRVMVVGGETATGGGGSAVSQAEVYDPRTGTFADAGTMVAASGGRLAIPLPDGRVVVFEPTMIDEGPVGAAIWDPATATFKEAGGLRHHVTGAVLLDDGRIFMIGVPTRDTTWAGVYDPVAETSVDLLAPSAWWPSMVRVTDGRVLIVGGLTDGNVRDTGGWRLAPAVPTVEIFQ
jgi:Kelch motif protein